MTSPSAGLSEDINLRAPVDVTRETKEPLRYRCETCAKAFTRSATLKQHIRKHTGEKPYKCGSCSKAFARLKDKNRHEILHDTERNFICEGKVNVKNFDYSWGCGKKFARKDGLVAHLKPPENRCFRHLSEFPMRNFDTELYYSPKYLKYYGTWTCSFEQPWSSLDKFSSSAGCGRQFEGAQLLQHHISFVGKEDSKCWLEMITRFRTAIIGRALGRAIQISKSDEVSKKLDSHPLRYRNINIRNTRSWLGVKAATVQVKLDFPAETECWRPFALNIGGKKVTDFKMYTAEPSSSMGPLYVSTTVKTYWLNFTVPNSPHPSQIGGLIRLRGNLEGDYNSFSYDSIILGVFEPGNGELVAPDEPRRAQLQAFMDVKSIPVWHEGEEIARFAGEVSVTRKEYNLWDKNAWDGWDGWDEW